MCYEISNRLLVKFDQHLYCCADKDYGLITVVEISLFTSEYKSRKGGNVSLNLFPADEIHDLTMNTVE